MAAAVANVPWEAPCANATRWSAPAAHARAEFIHHCGGLHAIVSVNKK
jgi:hypothetical protein